MQFFEMSTNCHIFCDSPDLPRGQNEESNNLKPSELHWLPATPVNRINGPRLQPRAQRLHQVAWHWRFTWVSSWILCQGVPMAPPGLETSPSWLHPTCPNVNPDPATWVVSRRASFPPPLQMSQLMNHPGRKQFALMILSKI